MKNNKILYLDPLLSISFALLIILGLLILASASMPMAEKYYNNPFYFFYNQAICLMFGLFILLFILFTSTETWRQLSLPMLYTSLFLLLLVLIIGVEVNGAKRWLPLPLVRFQVSEVFKFVIIIYMANFLESYSKEIRNNIKILLLPVFWLGLACILLLFEPDFGAAVVILLTFTGMVFVAGVPLRPLLVLTAIAAIAFGILAYATPYRFARLTTFMHPWDFAYSTGYQLTQALISYGRGDWLGLGLGGSIQKLFFLPEAHTDFIFAILAEELGLVGAIFVILLYLTIITRILYYGMQAQKKNLLWQAYLCYGCAFYFAAQSFISIGVNLGLLPTKGLTLPFLSYGRSSLLINCAFIGLVLRAIVEIKYNANISRYKGTFLEVNRAR